MYNVDFSRMDPFTPRVIGIETLDPQFELLHRKYTLYPFLHWLVGF